MMILFVAMCRGFLLVKNLVRLLLSKEHCDENFIGD